MKTDIHGRVEDAAQRLGGGRRDDIRRQAGRHLRAAGRRGRRIDRRAVAGVALEPQPFRPVLAGVIFTGGEPLRSRPGYRRRRSRTPEPVAGRCARTRPTSSSAASSRRRSERCPNCLAARQLTTLFVVYSRGVPCKRLSRLALAGGSPAAAARPASTRTWTTDAGRPCSARSSRRSATLRGCGSSSALRKAAPEAICQCELTPLFDISQQALARHMAVLGEAGIVGRERRGVWTYYYLATGALQDANVRG